MTTILSSIQTYLKTYTGLTTDAPVWVDYLGPVPTEYAIISSPGNRIIERYIDGSTLREFPFAFQSMESTADELARLDANGFFENFSEWLESQTEAGVLPVLSAGKTPELIEALGWGYLFQEGESQTGVYQIQCRLVYQQD